MLWITLVLQYQLILHSTGENKFKTDDFPILCFILSDILNMVCTASESMLA